MKRSDDDDYSWACYVEQSKTNIIKIDVDKSFRDLQLSDGMILIFQQDMPETDETEHEQLGVPMFPVDTVVQWAEHNRWNIEVAVTVHDWRTPLRVEGVMANGDFSVLKEADAGKMRNEHCNFAEPTNVRTHLDARWCVADVLQYLKGMKITTTRRVFIFSQNPFEEDADLLAEPLGAIIPFNISSVKARFFANAAGQQPHIHVVVPPAYFLKDLDEQKKKEPPTEIDTLCVRFLDTHVREISSCLVSGDHTTETIADVVQKVRETINLEQQCFEPGSKLTVMEIHDGLIQNLYEKENQDKPVTTTLAVAKRNFFYNCLHIFQTEELQEGYEQIRVQHVERNGQAWGFPFVMNIPKDMVLGDFKKAVSEKLDVPEVEVNRWRVFRQPLPAMAGEKVRIVDDTDSMNPDPEQPIGKILLEHYHTNPSLKRQIGGYGRQGSALRIG